LLAVFAVIIVAQEGQSFAKRSVALQITHNGVLLHQRCAFDEHRGQRFIGAFLSENERAFFVN